LIFSMVPESYAAIAKTCKACLSAQSENVMEFSGSYYQIPEIRELLPNRDAPQTKHERREYVKDVITRFKMIYRYNPEVDENGKPIKLPSTLGPLAPEYLQHMMRKVQLRSDQNLIKCSYVFADIHTIEDLPDNREAFYLRKYLKAKKNILKSHNLYLRETNTLVKELKRDGISALPPEICFFSLVPASTERHHYDMVPEELGHLRMLYFLHGRGVPISLHARFISDLECHYPNQFRAMMNLCEGLHGRPKPIVASRSVCLSQVIAVFASAFFLAYAFVSYSR
jgi:hypothetical protein